ncbi:hypothetical protein T552_01112 [Pneumocystis carinii B80]|uniref:Major surface glycoprotein 2 C-terminal domain-containing protein n=2 Tax=Pneumocystis carinii TaxID=4754 RepID=A0A0W4ZNF1_PNEC8|nr:hypothetical protein T552_01112 [Pneumocystis carinii B80]KTW29908.1 hypothetical protein T552_01112 [Pneumocystis carinii B80]CAH17855.1 Major Surface Glycoprotein (MSG), putative [Pneumocystis carinii]CAH17897.1 Major Surface Glycoprotein (MSG), putative [Pneumocystis carinii]
MARLVKRQAQVVQKQDDIKEEHLLAFILKEKYDKEEQCKQELKKYCEELKEIDGGSDVNKNVKEICDEAKRDKKCTGLKAKVEAELDTFDTELEDELGKLKDENCKKYEEKCILLEGTGYSEDIKKNCVELREGCYELKRKKVAEELLLRALGKEAKNDGECKEKMKTVCSVLSRESDELMSFCLDPTKTCETLKKKSEEVCNLLKTKLDGKSSEKCHERLEKCHFYGEACTETKCEEDKTKCEKEGVIYKAPESDFSPVKPKASLLRSIGLEDVYKRAEKEGIIIGKSGVDLPRKSGTNFLQDLLLLLSRDEKETDATSKCKKALGKCDTSKYLDHNLKDLCDKNDNDKCKALLDVNVKERCTNLKLNLYLKDLSTEYDKESKVLFWRELPTLFTKGECVELESECFYLKKACKDSKIDEACQNVRAACYKKGQDRMLNTFFQKELKGKLGHVRFYSDPKDCKKYVVENCTKLKEDKRYLSKCLYPKELCYGLSNDIFLQSKELSALLDDQRDFPLEKDCVELGEKCDQLSSDSLLNLEKCITLKRRCEYFRVSEGFRNVLLKRKDDSLMTQENCTKALHEKCDALSRRRKNSFSVSCALPEETCSYMVFHTSQDCKYLKENIKNGGIVGKIGGANGNETALEELCTTWGRHCHQLVKNCPEQLKKKENGNDNDHNCDKLEEKCRDTFEKLKAKEELTHLLKGNLKDDVKCKEALGKGCTELQKDNTFKILLTNCEEGTKGTVCKKLVDKVKKKCPTLKTDLENAKEELTKMKTEYDALKQAAEKSTKEAKLLLSKPRQTVMPSAQNSSGSVPAQPPAAPAAPEAGSSSSPQGPPSSPESSSTSSGTPGTTDGTAKNPKFGLVKRAYVAEGVSEAEVKAFDATTIALELYLELKEECKALQLDCGFKEECPDTKQACENIDTLCKLEPLEIKPHHTEKITATMTETKTIEKTTEKTSTTTITITKPVGGGKVTEQCTLVRTTDIWVTSTSLHTSTVTSTPTVTSTVTLTSMRKCKPTKCTTDSSEETH